jgi:large subunit ribosomal protein L6
MPITVPKGVDIKVDGATVTVKGAKGELKRTFDPRMTIKVDGGVGVSDGFSKILEITQDSVGYRAEMKGKDLELFLGFSHTVHFPAPAGISFATDTKTRRITISGIDKELVGETAAQIRKLRPPEPYKGKGIKYMGEVIRRKAGKAGKTGKGAK